MSENESVVATKTPSPKYPTGSVSIPQTSGSGRFRWTVDTFHRAADAGIFPEPKQWELVNGEIVDREMMNPPHSFICSKIGNLMRRIFEPQSRVLEEKSVRLSTDGEPVPDVCVVIEQGDEYMKRHPTQDDIRLLIEVADTTEVKDTGEKADLYAVAGITDYWVVLINRRQVNVYRDTKNGKYLAPLELKDGDTVSPLAAPDVTIAVSDLLPPALVTAGVEAIQ